VRLLLQNFSGFAWTVNDAQNAKLIKLSQQLYHFAARARNDLLVFARVAPTGIPQGLTYVLPQWGEILRGALRASDE
jgi:hypothetical protein